MPRYTTQLPPVSEKNQAKERIYRTGLEASDYLRLENEAISRSLRPFTLVKIVMTAYLNGDVVYVNQLPEDLQQQIKQYQGKANA